MMASILDHCPTLKNTLSLFSENPEPFFRMGVRVLTRMMYRPHFIGFDNIPETGAGLIIANHVSYVDGMIIQTGCKRPIRFVIDDYIYRQPGVHYFMSHNRAIPILPTRDSVSHALDEISEGLKAGDLICIFPEGQLTYTGSLGRFKPGIEYIIRRDMVPVYPVALKGLWGSIFSRKYLKAHFRFFPRSWRREVTAICGPAIAPETVNVNHLQETVLRLKYQIG